MSMSQNCRTQFYIIIDNLPKLANNLLLQERFKVAIAKEMPRSSRIESLLTRKSMHIIRFIPQGMVVNNLWPDLLECKKAPDPIHCGQPTL